MNRTRRVRVALAFHLHGGYFDEVLQGVGEAISHRPQWIPHGYPAYVCPPVGPLEHWAGDAAIVAEGSDQAIQAMRDRGVSVIDLRGNGPIDGVSCLDVDNHAIGRRAAEFFLARGYRSFLCYFSRQRHALHRREGFQDALAEAGHTCALVDADVQPHVSRRLLAAVSELPPPVAVFASSDLMGYSACRALGGGGIAVPQTAALLGVDNAPLICRFSDPPLSSIALPTVRLGQLAVQTLEQMLAGRPGPGCRLLGPLDVVERRSTAPLAVDDPLVSAGLQFIADHADQPIQVRDVAAAVATGERTLQRRFARAIGRTVWQEIHRAHLARAERLLSRTQMSVAEIAIASGLGDFRRMARAFRKTLHVSPSEYRRRTRDGAPATNPPDRDA